MNIPSKTGREERILEGILSKSSRKFKGEKGKKRKSQELEKPRRLPRARFAP